MLIGERTGELNDLRRRRCFRKHLEAAVIDLEDAPAFAGALCGAQGVCLLIPPSFTAPSYRAFQTDVARSLAAAAAESRIPHVAHVELITGIRSGALTFEGGHRRVAPRTSLEAVFRPRTAG